MKNILIKRLLSTIFLFFLFVIGLGSVFSFKENDLLPNNILSSKSNADVDINVKDFGIENDRSHDSFLLTFTYYANDSYSGSYAGEEAQLIVSDDNSENVGSSHTFNIKDDFQSGSVELAREDINYDDGIDTLHEMNNLSFAIKIVDSQDLGE